MLEYLFSYYKSFGPSTLGYKKALSKDKHYNVIITLAIPYDAITNIERKGIVNADTAYHRCNKAKVIKIETVDGIQYEEAVSYHASSMAKPLLYKVNEMVEVDNYDMDLDKVCSTGIHFFLTKSMAEQYECVSIENGILTRYASNGAISEQTSFVNGKKNGIEIRYCEDGSRKEVTYVNNYLHGLAVTYDKNNNITEKHIWADNRYYTINTDTGQTVDVYTNKIKTDDNYFGEFLSFGAGFALGAFILHRCLEK